jgi:hypothetical protein
MPSLYNRGVTIRDVTRIAVAMEQLGKYVSAERNTRNSRRSVFSVHSVQHGTHVTNMDLYWRRFNDYFLSFNSVRLKMAVNDRNMSQ